MGRPETQNRTPPLRALLGISVLENAKERPSAWPSVVFMEPWSTLGPLLTQATLLTQPNLFKEAPWVGQRRQTGPPPLRALSGISVLENAKERPSAWPSVVFMEPWSTLGPLLTQATLLTQPNLFKEAPWVGQRRQTGPPLCGPFRAFQSSKTPRKGRAPGQALFSWSHGAP